MSDEAAVLKRAYSHLTDEALALRLLSLRDHPRSWKVIERRLILREAIRRLDPTLEA